MVDRLISRGLSVLVMGLITLTFGGAILFGYRGFFEILGRHWVQGGLLFAAAGPLSLGAWMLIRHKDDLMDR